MTLVAVLAESREDAFFIKTILQRLTTNLPAPKMKDCRGGGNLKERGERFVRNYLQQGCEAFVLCHDADSHDPQPIADTLRSKIVQRCGIGTCSCILVPVQELEAWIAADPDAVKRVIPSFAPPMRSNPEGIQSPKEWLIRASRANSPRQLYSPPLHNPEIAAHLSIETVRAKCPSFDVLVAFAATL